MEQILEFISKNYVYIPASVLAALGIIIPAIIKIAKICTSNAAMSIKLALIRKEVNEIQDDMESLRDDFIDELEEEKDYLLNQNRITINKKVTELNNQRIAVIKSKLATAYDKKAKVKAIKEANKESETAKKKKVRVKIIKKAIE